MSLLSLLGVDRLIDSWSERARIAAAEGAGALEARALLAKLEWAEEKSRLQQLVVLSVLCIGLSVAVLMGISMALVVHFWDSPSRSLIAWCIVLFWGVVWLVCVILLLRVVRRADQAFKLTRQELTKDWDAIKERF